MPAPNIQATLIIFSIAVPLQRHKQHWPLAPGADGLVSSEPAQRCLLLPSQNVHPIPAVSATMACMPPSSLFISDNFLALHPFPHVDPKAQPALFHLSKTAFLPTPFARNEQGCCTPVSTRALHGAPPWCPACALRAPFAAGSALPTFVTQFLVACLIIPTRRFCSSVLPRLGSNVKHSRCMITPTDSRLDCRNAVPIGTV